MKFPHTFFQAVSGIGLLLGGVVLIWLSGCKPREVSLSAPLAPPVPAVFSITSLPYTITQAGTYRVASDLVGGKGLMGISVQANNVVLDLNHKWLNGGESPGSGLLFQQSISNVMVINGTIAGWMQGVLAPFSSSCLFSNLQVLSNAVGMSIAYSNVVVRCVFSHNAGGGLSVQDGCQVRDCRAENNRGDGFTIGHEGVVENCQAISNVLNGFFAVMQGTFFRCEAAYNDRSGIYARASSVISNCAIVGNRYDGMELASGCLVTYNQVYSNINNGIHVFGHSTVVSNQVAGNRRDGIRAVFNNRIISNVCEGNATDGTDTGNIHVILKFNQIDNNEVVIDQTIGIKAKTAPNQVLKNTVRHRAASGGLAYQCKAENLASPVLQREKFTNDPPNANYEWLKPSL